MTTYNEFIAETVSEKITLAHVHCKWRAFTFTNYSGSIQHKTMDYYVSAVDQDSTSLTLAANADAVVAGTYFFDAATNCLYIYSADIDNSEVVVTFRLFFSTAPVKLPYDLSAGDEVFYEPRIKSASGVTAKISEEIKGLALIGNSKLTLEGEDGYFDSIYEKYVWDNKEVTIYSFNRDLASSEAKVIYRGFIGNKSFNGSTVSFSLKDYLRLLDKNVHDYKYDENDDVNDDVISQYKRRVFGKVDGLKLQSIDQLGETLTLTGTLGVFLNEGTGTTWQVKDELNTPRYDNSACGILSAGLTFGGASIGSGTIATTEEYNSLTWSAGGTANIVRGEAGSAGLQNSGLFFSGQSAGPYDVTTEKYNGSTWSYSGNVNSGMRYCKGTGTQSASVKTGGYNGSGNSTITELFNGSTWSNSGAMSIARYGHSSCNTTVDALVIGGIANSVSDRDSCEKFNGSTWSTISDLLFNRIHGTSGGSGSNMAIAGYSALTESWISYNERYEATTDTWYLEPGLNTVRSRCAGSGEDSTDSSLDAFVCGGQYYNGPVARPTEIAQSGTHVLRGIGSAFLTELTPGDKLTLGGTDFEISGIYSDTTLSLVSPSTVEVSTATVEAKLEDPFNEYNRVYEVSPTALKEYSTTFESSLSTTLFKVTDLGDIVAGDIIQVDTSPAQEREVSRVITSQNQIEITLAWDTTPTDGVTAVDRPAVQSVYLQKQKVDFDLYTVSNTTAGCTVTFADTFERDFVPDSGVNLPNSYYKRTYENKIRYSDLNDQLKIDDLKSRDYIKFDGASPSDWLEVLEVKDDFIRIREATIDYYYGQLLTRRTTILDDDTTVSADVYGETEDGSTSGTWIKSSSQLFEVLLTDAGYGDRLDTASFTEAESTEYARLSVITPESIDKTGETLKSLIKRVNESVNGVLTVNDELDLKYLIFDATIDYDNLTIIEDSDVISWAEKASSPPIYSDLSTQYRFKDVDYLTERKDSNVYTFTNDFVNTYVGIEKTKNSKHYLYDEIDVLSTTQRQAFLSTQIPKVYQMKSDLRYQNEEIGNLVQLNFIDTTSGTTPSTNKIGMIVGIAKKGETVDLTVSDLGNVFERRASITIDAAPDYTSATGDEKLIYSYITDSNGLSNADEDTNGTNLII